MDERPVWSVALPEDAEPPFQVWVNGEPRAEGADYTVDGRWLRFTSPLKPKQRMGFGRSVMLSLGIGVYGDLKADVVDVRYSAGGTTRIASGLTVIGPPPG